MTKCPVCGSEIDETSARMTTGFTLHGAAEADPKKGTRQFHEGKWYYFDSLECRSKFLARPDTYTRPA